MYQPVYPVFAHVHTYLRKQMDVSRFGMDGIRTQTNVVAWLKEQNWPGDSGGMLKSIPQCRGYTEMILIPHTRCLLVMF